MNADIFITNKACDPSGRTRRKADATGKDAGNIKNNTDHRL